MSEQMIVPCAVRSVRVWLSLAVVLALAMPTTAAAATIAGLPPVMSLYDAPLTRNPTLELILMLAPGQPDVVVERRAANDPTTVDGVLANGQVVSEAADWTLAAGPDGMRTVYGQLKYASGVLSPVGSVSIELDQDPGTSVFFDIDASSAFYDISAGGPEPDWHEHSSTRDDVIYGSGFAIPTADVAGFSVSDPHWSFTFMRHDADIVAGSYETEPLGATECDTTCAVIGLDPARHCAGTGTVEIHEIAFTSSGDLATVSADFRLDCSVYGVMSGSIRYGSDQPIDALDQSTDDVSPGLILVGQSAAPQSVTFTNVGDRSMVLGSATLVGEAPEDWAIVGGACAGTTLAVDETCTITVRFTPTAFGYRFATLSLEDETVRGSRRVRLVGNANHATSLSISVDPPADGPGPAEVTVTISPASAGPATFLHDGNGTLPISTVVTTLTDPSRLEVVYTITLTPGPHHLEAEYPGAAWHLPSGPVSVDLAVSDSGRPWGFMFIGGGPTAASRTVKLTALPYPYSDLAIDKLGISNDGVTWTERVAKELHDADWLLTAGDGEKTVYLRWHEAGTDQWSPVVTDTVILAGAPPSVTAPTQNLVQGSTITSGQVPMRVSWSGTAGSDDVARYELAASVDGGPWSMVSTTLTDTSIDRLVAPGHTYRHRVTAIDEDGRVSLVAAGASTTVARFSENNRRVSYSGSWSTARNPVYWLGAARKSTRAGAKASITFSGRSIGWVVRKGPDRGKAEVFVNGTRVATIDLHATTYQGPVIAWSSSWSSSVSRKVTIRVLGTKGRPRVDLDAFVTLQ